MLAHAHRASRPQLGSQTKEKKSEGWSGPGVIDVLVKLTNGGERAEKDERES